MRVAVIGAGLIGASVARELAIRGADVTIFEQHQPGGGTSGTTFAWVNSHDKRPESYHRLNAEGCRQHQRLANDHNHAQPWFVRTGNLEWAANGPGRRLLEERVGRLDALGYPCQWLERKQIEGIEPDVQLPADVDRIAFFPEEGHVLPAVLLGWLLGQARDRGATLACRARVVAIDADSTAATITLEGGEHQRFDRVVSCVGRWTQDLLLSSGVQVPLADPDVPGGPAVGLLAYTAPLPSRLSRVLTTSHINVRPDEGGRLVLQGLDLDSGADPANPPGRNSAEAQELVDRLGKVLRLGELAEVESIRVGQRALPADGLTVAGSPEQEDRLYVVATHSGVTLAPLLGRLVAGEVVDDEESAMLSDFRPSRFAHGDAAVTVAAARRAGEQ